MEFRYIQSFLAIAEELHFGRAAARLHIAQPSLSQQLQRLERELGVQLVARTSHEVRLTPAGRAFQDEARRILAQTDRAVQAAREAAAGRTGTVNVGFNFPAGQRVLPLTLTRLQEHCPGIEVNLEEKRSGPQLAALRSGELDVALVYGRPTDPQLASRQVLTVPLVAVVGARHPWARRDQVAFRELTHQTCVLFHREQSPAMFDAIHSAAEHSQISLTVDGEVDDALATAIVVTTRPVVAFASTVRGQHVTSTGVATVPLVDPTPTVDIHTVWRAEDTRPVVRAFLDCLATDEGFHTHAGTGPGDLRRTATSDPQAASPA